MTNGANLLSCEAEFAYNPEQLSFVDIGCSNLLDGFTKQINPNDHRIKVTGAGSLPDGQAGVFATLQFVVNENFSGSEIEVKLSSLRLNEDLVRTNISLCTLQPMVSVDKKPELPTKYSLKSNYPNPFNPTTTFKYELPEESKVVLSVFDMSGRLVETIVNQTQSAGYYSVQWSANEYSSGAYIYLIQVSDPANGGSNGFTAVKKCLLIK